MSLKALTLRLKAVYMENLHYSRRKLVLKRVSLLYGLTAMELTLRLQLVSLKALTL